MPSRSIPSRRAGETLAALLFRRGDVATSKLTIPFLVRGPEDLTGRYAGSANPSG